MYGWRVLAVYSGKGESLADGLREKAFSHCHIYVSKFSEVQVRELKRPVIDLENFGHQNGKMRLKVCLVRKGLNPL